MYKYRQSGITLGMRTQSAVPAGSFKALFNQLISPTLLGCLVRRGGAQRRRPPLLSAVKLIGGLVFHTVARSGSLAEHVKEVSGITITDGALSQRRALLPIELFDEILRVALKPKADPVAHPQAFYHGLRLCGVDGSLFSVTNTPQVKKEMNKARTRRGRAAFPKVGVAVMVELGLHNPLAVALGAAGESERVLSQRVLAAQPEKSLVIKDRYYGCAQVLVDLPEAGQRHFLVRVKKNHKRRLIEVHPDGSALVEISSGKRKRLVREILGRVRRGERGAFTTVRLWTSLLDWRRHPAAELLALYGRRWEQEGFYKELKVDLRSGPCLQSHTPLTAMQEIAALILAYACLVDCRVKAAAKGSVEVLRISFLKTLHIVQGLWQFLELSSDMLSPDQVKLVVQRALRRIAQKIVPQRRQRTCQRALRQPVSSWPRLRKNTYRKGNLNYSVGTIYA